MDLFKTAKWSAVTFTSLMIFSTFRSAGLIHKYQGQFDLPITDKTTTSATININEHLTIHDIDIGLNISHTSAFDLQLLLRSPAGTTICLNGYNFDEFFTGANYLNSIFDDEANLSIENANPPFTGRFKPKSPAALERFDNEDAFGTWELRVYDAWHADTGTLENFGLSITTPEPHSAMLFILCALGVIILKPKNAE